MLRKLVLIFILPLVFYSCSKSEKLSVAISPLQLNDELDPKNISFTNQYYLIENLSVRLIEMTTSGRVNLILAKSMERPDEKTYIFKIKKTMFSDGSIITTTDIQESFNRILKDKSVHVDLNSILEEIKVIDEETIKFQLKKKYQ